MLSREELKPKVATVVRSLTGEDLATDEFVDEIFTLIDTDGSGTIDIEEFVAGFASNTHVAALLADQ